MATILRKHSDWSLRVRAATALGVLPREQVTSEGYEALALAAREDAYALARQAAVESLGRVAKDRARALLAEVAKHDDELQVREAAKRAIP